MHHEPAIATLQAGFCRPLTAVYILSLRNGDGNEVAVARPALAEIADGHAGYWNQPELTAESIVDDWFDTGDVLSVDADGFLWFFGRGKQIIVHDGSNISPLEIEASLLTHLAVARAGIAGVARSPAWRGCLGFRHCARGAEPATSTSLIEFSREKVG